MARAVACSDEGAKRWISPAEFTRRPIDVPSTWPRARRCRDVSSRHFAKIFQSRCFPAGVRVNWRGFAAALFSANKSPCPRAHGRIQSARGQTRGLLLAQVAGGRDGGTGKSPRDAWLWDDILGRGRLETCGAGLSLLGEGERRATGAAARCRGRLSLSRSRAGNRGTAARV